MSQQDERRKTPRKDVSFDLQVRAENGQVVGNGRAINLSEGGCLILVSAELKPRAQVTITFMPGSNEGATAETSTTTHLSLVAEIIHCIRRPVPVARFGFGVGARFVDKDATRLEALRRLLAEIP